MSVFTVYHHIMNNGLDVIPHVSSYLIGFFVPIDLISIDKFLPLSNIFYYFVAVLVTISFFMFADQVFSPSCS